LFSAIRRGDAGGCETVNVSPGPGPILITNGRLVNVAPVTGIGSADLKTELRNFIFKVFGNWRTAIALVLPLDGVLKLNPPF
jgi:hypothetical protein